MNKQVVINIMRKIFKYYGYRVKSSEISDLQVAKDNENLFIKFDPSVGYESIRDFSNNVHKYNGKGIVISEDFDEKIINYGAEQGLILWDKNELESRIGKAVLSGALMEHEERTEVRPEETEISAKVLPQEEKRDEYEKTVRLLLHSVPVNIGKSDSLSIAEAKIGKAKIQKLTFIPVWYYVYSFDSQKKFKSRIIDLNGEGEGYIDALTNDNYYIKYNDIKDNIFVPTQNYEIIKPVIEKKDAESKATDAIIRDNAKEMRINEMIGDTIVFEHKVFTPDPEDIDLQIELLYIPVWEIAGKRDIIQINAYDGHIKSIKPLSKILF